MKAEKHKHSNSVFVGRFFLTVFINAYFKIVVQTPVYMFSNFDVLRFKTDQVIAVEWPQDDKWSIGFFSNINTGIFQKDKDSRKSRVSKIGEVNYKTLSLG